MVVESNGDGCQVHQMRLGRVAKALGTIGYVIGKIWVGIGLFWWWYMKLESCVLTRVLRSVWGGWVACRRMAGSLTIYARSCKNVRPYLECRENDVSVHTGTLFAIGEMQRCRLTDFFYFVCTPWFVRSQKASAQAKYCQSRRDMKKDVGCIEN